MRFADDVRLAPTAFSNLTIMNTYLESLSSHVVDMMLRLNGAGDYVYLPDVPVGGPTVTLQAWVYAADPYGPGQCIIDLSDSTTLGVLYLGLQYSGRLVYVVDNRPDPGARRAELVSPDPMPRYRWTHVAVTQSPAGVAMYWDGVIVVRLDDMCAHLRTSASLAWGNDWVSRLRVEAFGLYFGEG